MCFRLNIQIMNSFSGKGSEMLEGGQGALLVGFGGLLLTFAPVELTAFMRIDIITVYSELLASPFQRSIMTRTQEKGLLESDAAATLEAFPDNRGRRYE